MNTDAKREHNARVGETQSGIRAVPEFRVVKNVLRIFDALQWFIWKSTTANCYSVARSVVAPTMPYPSFEWFLSLVHRNAVNDFQEHTQKKKKKKKKAAQKWHIENNERSNLNGIRQARAKIPSNERTVRWKNMNFVKWFSMRLKREIVLSNRRTRKTFSNPLFTFMRAQQHRKSAGSRFGFVILFLNYGFEWFWTGEAKANANGMLYSRFECVSKRE